MDESEDNLSAEEIKFENSSSVKVKPKKRSLVERELETSLTARVTSPILNKDATSTSRYGRARRLKTETDFCDTDKAVAKCLKSPKCDIAKSPNKIQSPAYKMHASNSPIRVETPKKEYLNNQIETIYSENISLSRFRPEEKKKSVAKKFPKVYIRKDLIQTKEREIDDTVVLIKNIFSPTKSVKKSKPGISLESSSEKNYSSKPNGYMNSLSVVKALDFDGNKKKKRDDRKSLSKSELFDLEAKCEYQVGDLAWARMGTYPFWPCIITRDPLSGMFVKKKLFGRIERDVMHVTFFGDNGRRGWIVDSMLRKFLGQLEFEATRINFSAEAKKKDPRLYTAFFISEKKTPQWQISVEEAEALLREPKRLRIDILNDMIEKSRALKTTPKQEKGRKVMRTNSDVSLSESLYDTLFSEDDSKVKETEGARSKSRNTSLDVSEVVTACLDNMAAKTGITRIQRQSHMDRWLQKAKSKTPEKSHHKSQIKESNSSKYKKRGKDKGNNKCKSYNRHNDHDYSQMYSLRNSPIIIDEMEIEYNNAENYDIEPGSGIGIISKVETLCGKEQYNDSTNADFINEIATENVAQSTDIESDIEQSNSVGSTFCGNDQNNGVSLKIVCQQNTDIESDIEQLDSVESSFCVNDQNNEVSPKIVCQKRIDIESDIERLDSVDSALCGNDQNNEVSPQIVCQQSTDIESDIEHLDSVESALCGNDQNNKVLQKIVCQQSTDIESDIEQLDSVESALCGSDQDNKVLQKIVCQQSTDIESDIEPLSSVESALCPNQKNEVSTQVMCQQSIGIESDIEQLDSVESSYCVNDQNNEVSPKIVCQQRTDIESDIEQLISIEPALCGNDQNNEVLPPIVCQQNTDIVSDVEQLDSVESDFSAGDQNNEGPRKIVCQQSTDIESDIEQLNSVESALCGNDQNNEVSPKIVCQQSTDIESDIEQLNSVESAEISSIQSELTDDHDKNESELIYEQNNEVELSTVAINEINKTHLIFSKIPDITDNNILDNIFATDDSSSDVDTNNESIENDAGKCENDEKATNFDNVVEIFSTEEHIDKNSQEGLFKVINQNESIDDQESGLDVNTSSVECVELDLESDIINSAIKTIVPLKEDQTLNEFNNSEVKINEDADFHKNNAINSETDVHEVDNNIEEIISPIIANSKSRKPRLKLSLKRSVVKDQTADKNINVTEVNLNMNNVSNNQLQNGDIGINVDECVNLKELPQHVKIIDENREKTDINKDIESESLTSDINEIQRVDENMMRTNYEEHSNFNQVNTPKEIETQNQGTTKTDDLTSDIKIQHIGLDIKENENEDVTYMNEEKQKDDDNVSVISDGSEISVKRKRVKEKPEKKSLLTDPEFLKYLELRQDAVIDEHPELSQDDITSYLYKTWIYEENLKPDIKKTDDIDQANLVKGLNLEPGPLKKVRKRIKVDKEIKCENTIVKEKSKRKIIQPYYKEDFSDGDDSVEYFDIFKLKKDQKGVVPECKEIYQSDGTVLERIVNVDEYVQDEYDDVEEYFRQLTAPKPNVFKGYIREKVCDVCEKVGNLVKCKGCHSMFHIECDKKEIQITECQTPTRGRRKKKKTRGRKARDDPSQDSGSDEKSQDTNGSEELHMSVEEESHLTANADDFETLMAARMQEILRDQAIKYDFYYREELDWNDTHVGECKVVDIKPRLDSIEITDYSEFKCKNCQKYDPPVCFVCKYPISPKENQGHRQKCQVAHCNKYYHLECLDHWPQTQFNAGEVSRTNKFSEALTCPRHVCHTCVCDDPRGCKTRFSGDKLARCIRCPATYHTFTKCLPAGSQILTASHIICPRHYEHRPGKVPCHVNTGWCFICALGGSLICCEYCPTSFHAECLNIKPPEGGYMCEDCETGRLPLYGEMVWVKLGHYRWWPGIILHPSEIPDNILAVKHTLGEFVVRFFGQYDYYWVNRGRVFPFQEGDSGKVSSQRSKIDAAFTMAMEHAQRACGILKMAAPNEEESSDIASSLLPPHYVKLKVNKPCGSLCGKKIDLEESSLTQCECDPNYVDPCGPYTQCLNRMLLTECGPTCRAGDRCNNRAFEKRLYPRLAPYRTPHRGWGLRTLQDIRAGQFVIEYVGELIDEEEFRRRMNRKHEVRDENFYFLTLDKERMIDAGPKGNLARFMNHSCEPNCETQKWTVLGDVRVGLFAICDIPANSELTFNYNLETSGIEKKRCMCGAKRCSGYIGAKPKQEDQPKKIKPQVKRSYRKRKVEDSPSTSQYKKRGRPMKPRELTEIEKDLLIIKNATNGLSSDSECSRISIDSCKDSKALKRKRINLSSEEMSPKRSKDEMNLVY